MSYGTKMIGAILAAVLVGGPLSKFIGVKNPTMVGVLVGGLMYGLLTILPFLIPSSSSGSNLKIPAVKFLIYIKLLFIGATQEEIIESNINTDSKLFKILFKRK